MRRAGAVLLLGLLGLALAAPAVDARAWAWLGVRIRDLSESEMDELSSRHGIREGYGVFIVEVMEDTPAARAGLRSGDLVVAFGERPVTETRLLQRLIASAPIGVDLELTVLRQDGRHDVAVRLAAMPAEVAGDRVAADFGFALRDPREADVAGLRASSVASVAVVARDGPAERAGLQVGDVVLQVGDRPVMSAEAGRRALAEIPADRPLRLEVRRDAERLSLTLPPP